MSILKFENRTPRTMEQMFDYLTDRNKTSLEGIFSIGCNPFYSVEEMQFVQKVYHRTDLTHPYLQVIFAFDTGVELDIFCMRDICMEIGNILLTDKRQLFGAIHYLGKDCDKPHCHYMINFVGIDGSLYKQKYSLRHYKSQINKILIYNELNPIAMYESE